VETLEFGISLILVPLLYGLKNHVIVGSVLPEGRLLIINLIEQAYQLIAGTPIIFYILQSSLTIRIGGVIVGVIMTPQNFTPDLTLPSMQSMKYINQA
jgi:hypothetical protein